MYTSYIDIPIYNVCTPVSQLCVQCCEEVSVCVCAAGRRGLPQPSHSSTAFITIRIQFSSGIWGQRHRAEYTLYSRTLNYNYNYNYTTVLFDYIPV